MADFVAYLTESLEIITQPLITMWSNLVEASPGLLAALIVIIIGYIIAWILGWVVKSVLLRAGLDEWIKRAGRANAIGYVSLSKLLGRIAKWYIFVGFLIPAVGFIQLGALSDLLTKLVLWLPGLITALIIIIFGLLAADFVADKIAEMKGLMVRPIAGIVRLIIIFFIAVIALQQMGIVIKIADKVFLIFIAGAVLAISLAVGIGFGLGLKEEARSIVRKIKRRL